MDLEKPYRDEYDALVKKQEEELMRMNAINAKQRELFINAAHETALEDAKQVETHQGILDAIKGIKGNDQKEEGNNRG